MSVYERGIRVVKGGIVLIPEPTIESFLRDPVYQESPLRDTPEAFYLEIQRIKQEAGE